MFGGEFSVEWNEILFRCLKWVREGRRWGGREDEIHTKKQEVTVLAKEDSA